MSSGEWMNDDAEEMYNAETSISKWLDSSSFSKEPYRWLVCSAKQPQELLGRNGGDPLKEADLGGLETGKDFRPDVTGEYRSALDVLVRTGEVILEGRRRGWRGDDAPVSSMGAGVGDVGGAGGFIVTTCEVSQSVMIKVRQPNMDERLIKWYRNFC